MTSIRYAPGKVWAMYVVALAAGIAMVIALNAFWSRGVLPGGIGALAAFTFLLLPGVIKRSSRAGPIVTIDARGITIDLPWAGTIAWDQIRSARATGSAFVGRRLVIEYAGTAPKVGVMGKLNWGYYAKQKGELVKLTLGYIEQTDQPKSVIEAALCKASPTAA